MLLDVVFLFMLSIHNSWNRCFVRHYHRSNGLSYGPTLVAWAKPLKRKTAGAQIDAFPTVNVYCNTCALHIFRYKKKNGTKSGLVKCYIERVIEDSAFLLRDQYDPTSRDELREQTFSCPQCCTTIARYAMVRGLPALKWVGGKIRMAKK
jgi:hypothetical protein